jgi:hypothetical protein
MVDIPMPSDLMSKRTLEWLEITLVLPDGPQRFQTEILDAEKLEPVSGEDLAKLIGLAHAAITMSENDDLFAPWYRERAQCLLRGAVDGLALIEARRQLRPSAGLN